jgi:hypothetical protein
VTWQTVFSPQEGIRRLFCVACLHEARQEASARWLPASLLMNRGERKSVVPRFGFHMAVYDACRISDTSANPVRAERWLERLRHICSVFRRQPSSRLLRGRETMPSSLLVQRSSFAGVRNLAYQRGAFESSDCRSACYSAKYREIAHQSYLQQTGSREPHSGSGPNAQTQAVLAIFSPAETQKPASISP